VLDAAPQHPVALNGQGSARQALGDVEGATVRYREALRAAPQYVEAHYNLGTALQLQGHLSDALGHYRIALELRGDWPVGLQTLAALLVSNPARTAADVQEAIRLATRADELTKHRSASVLDTLAAAYAADGQFDTAVSLQERALTEAERAEWAPPATAMRGRLAAYRRCQQQGKGGPPWHKCA